MWLHHARAGVDRELEEGNAGQVAGHVEPGHVGAAVLAQRGQLSRRCRPASACGASGRSGQANSGPPPGFHDGGTKLVFGHVATILPCRPRATKRHLRGGIAANGWLRRSARLARGRRHGADRTGAVTRVIQWNGARSKAKPQWSPDPRPFHLPVLLGTPRQGRSSVHAARFVMAEVAKRPGVTIEADRRPTSRRRR